MSAGDLFFVDSNVLLYFVDPVDSTKQARAAAWLEVLWASGRGRLSWQVLHEFYWNSVRKMRMEPAKARALAEDMSHWRPVDTSLGLMQQAWQWAGRSHINGPQLSYWDALILAAAERSGSRYLLSEDFQSQRHYEEIQVLNPFEHAPSEFAIPLPR